MNSKELLFDSFQTDYHRIGNLRFKRYRDLLGGEAGEMDRLEREMTQATLQMMTLSKRISVAKGISFDEAFEMISTRDNINPELLTDFAEDAFMLIASLPDATRINDELITMFMSSRAEIQGSDGQWSPFEDWTVQDSRKLPRKLREQIREFIDQERAGIDPEAAEKPVAGKPGKSEPDS